MNRIPCTTCGALILPTTAHATGGLCMPCKKYPGGKTAGDSVGRLGPLGKFLSGKLPSPPAQPTGWLELCTIEISTGKLWIGDPLIANAQDGCVAIVPPGTYAIEGIGCFSNCTRTVSRVRARLKSVSHFHVGGKIGEAGTDCSKIGICDIGAFDAACRGVEDKVQRELDNKIWAKGFGLLPLKKSCGAVLAFVPSGDGDGCGPVLELLDSGTPIGLQHDFFPDEATSPVETK